MLEDTQTLHVRATTFGLRLKLVDTRNGELVGTETTITNLDRYRFPAIPLEYHLERMQREIARACNEFPIGAL